ncbi:TPA: hypothetical protein DIC40_03600 [Patescibacteria group bacterium]|nr:hypothetical protein [Candidatus Gracilibacteria bacterium]
MGSIPFLTFGQIADSILVQTVRSDTLVVDSTQFIQHQLDSLTTIIDLKKMEITTLEQQAIILQKKIFSLHKNDSLVHIAVIPDSLIKQDSIISLPKQDSMLLVAKQDSTFQKDTLVKKERPVFFEVLSCVLLGRDSLAFRLHIKLNISEDQVYLSPALQGKVFYYVIGAQKKEVKLLSNIIIRDIILSTGDNYITVKRKIDMKSVPKYETKILIIDDFGLSLQIDGGKRILYFPDNYEFWEKKRKITF